MERSNLQSTSTDKQIDMSFNMSKVSVVTRVKQYTVNVHLVPHEVSAIV